MTGCGGYGALCVDKMDCEGGNDADVEACEIQFEYLEDYSSLHGCDPEWEDYYFCFEEQARCRDNPAPSTDRTFTAEGYCDNEGLDWADCVDLGFTF
jgi:hypothetical protein